MRSSSLMIAATAMSLSAPASAAAVFNWYDLTNYLTPSGSSPTTFNVAQFDPSLGALDGVSMQLFAQGDRFTVSCSSACIYSLEVINSGTVELGGFQLEATAQATSTTTWPFNSPFVADFGLNTFDSDSTGLVSDPDLLSAFIGTGQLTGQISGQAAAGCLHFGPCNAGVSLRAATPGTMQLFVAYVFTEPAAVPESSTWAMLLLGFGAIGAAMRRRAFQRGRPNPSIFELNRGGMRSPARRNEVR